MARKDLISWIGYWDRSSRGPTISAVKNRADLATCRLYNPVMTNGLMVDVSDDQMWAALSEYRRAA